jgi:hypothetical protein
LWLIMPRGVACALLFMGGIGLVHKMMPTRLGRIGFMRAVWAFALSASVSQIATWLEVIPEPIVTASVPKWLVLLGTVSGCLALLAWALSWVWGTMTHVAPWASLLVLGVASFANDVAAAQLSFVGVLAVVVLWRTARLAWASRVRSIKAPVVSEQSSLVLDAQTTLLS